MIFGARASERIVTKTILPALDMASSHEFYRTLGFDVEECGPEYAIVLHQREELLHLAKSENLNPSQNAAATYLHVQSADDWHARWQTSGIELSPIVDEPHGMREFRFRDPSGNLIRVGHNL